MTWPRKIIFVRHAQSVGNLLDVDARTALTVPTHAYPLTEYGEWQARATGQWLQKHIPDFHALRGYFQSYYQRSRDTLKWLVYPLTKTPIEDARLAEAQRGIYHAMPRAELAARYPEELARKELEGLYHYRAPGGENWLDVELRIHSFIDTLRRDYAGGSVLIVGHGHWFLMFQKIIHNWSAEHAVEFYSGDGTVPNASVTIYGDRSYDEGGVSRLSLLTKTFAPWAEVEAKEKAKAS